MNEFTIYCSPEQTKKAINLGAPIEVDFQFNFKTVIINNKAYIVPTAEQMLGWLEEQGIHEIRLVHLKDAWMFYIFLDGNMLPDEYTYPTRKEVTLAAIDAALEYLNNNKK